MLKLIVLLLAVLFADTSYSQFYTTNQLSSIASLLAIRPVPYYSRSDVYGHVEHLGVPLFTQKQRALLPSLVCDFLERSNLFFRVTDYAEKTRFVNENNIKVIFDEFMRVDTLCDFSLGETDRGYTATWTKNGRMVCEVSFDKSYYLISGMDVAESQRYFWKMVKDRAAKYSKAPLPDRTKLRPDSLFLVYDGGSYMINALRSDSYYSKQDAMPISSKNYPAQTWANVFMGLVDSGIDAEVRQVMFDFSETSCRVPLDKIVRYCISEGCRPYFGVESLDKGVLKATALFVNSQYSYNHLFYVEVNTIDGKVRLDINTYIPTNKLKNLYEEKR